MITNNIKGAKRLKSKLKEFLKEMENLTDEEVNNKVIIVTSSKNIKLISKNWNLFMIKMNQYSG
ncbi:hypothetical protein [Clostridium sp. ZS2-4]|uniref:hypothetical protein n=1 Tax=Clostridium sp. ZS2-4 TaxID=2987703 RepID=UPI00227D6DAC|nr:hypothetical protein [Clostridium sp. ZS2-4]MCY6354462.1 hypothetical protein [Clostridium sp. ZS2-4]